MNIIPIAIVAIVGAGSLYGESPRRDERASQADGGAEKGRNFKGFFESADANGDGVVSFDEFSALERISKLPEESQREIFKRFDKNHDGLIQAPEMRPPPRPDGGNRPFPKLHELDSDRDGTVSFAEFEAGPFTKRIPKERLKEFFARLDRNKDGKLSPADKPEERRSRDRSKDGGREPRDPAKMIEMLDGNDDRVLSFDEFRQAPWLKEKSEDEQEDHFEKLDKNGNLKLEPKELRNGGSPRPEVRQNGALQPVDDKERDPDCKDEEQSPRGPKRPGGDC
ncbi:EF-hand domain-containing protein [Haloferula chungangensis]|uniref:EF-hand domain-containing protein n=1 Tax=Haloferula chungangensis TaxID=1048331 RepID=A0ABW2L2M0_9BACT